MMVAVHLRVWDSSRWSHIKFQSIKFLFLVSSEAAIVLGCVQDGTIDSNTVEKLERTILKWKIRDLYNKLIDEKFEQNFFHASAKYMNKTCFYFI